MPKSVTHQQGKSLRFAFLRIKFILGANMNLWQYDNVELLQAAEMAFWMNDQKFADYVMEELAIRVTEEHPPDVPRDEGDAVNGEGLESEIKESAKETSSAHEREADYDSLCFERGRD